MAHVSIHVYLLMCWSSGPISIRRTSINKPFPTSCPWASDHLRSAVSLIKKVLQNVAEQNEYLTQPFTRAMLGFPETPHIIELLFAYPLSNKFINAA